MNFGITVTGLDPLPRDGTGTDIKEVFSIVRQLIMGKPRWDVEELAFMGIFSFTQFIMWNDLRNRAEDLKRSKVVASLLSGKLEWKPGSPFLTPEELDDSVSPADIAVPISADSSQLAAVHAAGTGESFVLHGPPGTGKSQTITNIIANALYQGKSVLFVAEKMAALSVVEKRLNAIGLGDFCLELHSNKARKKDVLDQLEKALNVGRIKPPEGHLDEADAIFALRSELNGVVRELHKPRQTGFSLFEAISRTEQYAGYPDGIAFTKDQIFSLTAKQYSRWVELCGLVSAAAASCGGVRTHALCEYINPAYSKDERANLDARLREYDGALSDLAETAGLISAALDLGGIKTHGQYSSLGRLCALMERARRVPAGLLTRTDKDRILAACETGRRRDAIQAELCAAYSEQILAFDAETALLQWNQANGSWFLPKALGTSKVAKAVKLYAKDQKSWQKSATPHVLELVCEYHRFDAAVKEAAPLLEMFDDPAAWLIIEETTRFAAEAFALIPAIAEDSPGEKAAAMRLGDILDRGLKRFTDENRANMSKFNKLWGKIRELESTLSAQFKNQFNQWHDGRDWIPAMREKTSRWLAALNGLRDYCGYLQVKSRFAAEGLQAVTVALETGAVPESELTGSFIKCISGTYASHIIDSSAVLSSFHGNMFTQKIEKLKAVNRRYETLTKQELAARLSAQIPMPGANVSDSSEIGILQRAIRSGGRMTPVRKLFENIPNLLRKLCPCMLMSPISVTQYLDPKHPAFDLVVFDEASQLPTGEAVGAIARGKELIVVGDPKQLPPTSFFTSNQIDEDNYDKEDLESVLEDCLALSMPQEYLRWHYRSRHESLIAFSNRKYYENKLYTFPSPNDIVSQVRLMPVEGFYDRGKTKQNKAEAEAIVREIIRRLSDPVLKTHSIGVVTFSSVQQNLIADMLEAEFAKHPDLDEAANQPEEPIFVKNLENVQGDERDVILFSIGYGPDEQGRVALNFGPLNREGGWRRLNVAVSRARHEMLIFSVLKPEQIDLNRTRADGVAGLKVFLEFAARGTAALPDAGDRASLSSGVIDVIAEQIKSLGFDVRTGIGCSGYRVDIGVLHPDKPDIYALGILCDGESYYKGGTALDRNNTQEAVLRGLGWRICRIWTLDWWDDSEKELSRINTEIEAAIAADAIQNPPAVEAVLPESPKVFAFEKYEKEAPNQSLREYAPARLEPVGGFWGNSDYFAGYESTRIICSQIEAVMEAEAPVSRDVLCKRVLEAWGISRMGARISRRFDELISAMRVKSVSSVKGVCYWHAESNPEQYDDFRVPSAADEKTRRNLEHIPPEEMASAIKYVLNRQISLSQSDLDREISRIFGFARCTDAMQKHIRAGLDVAVSRHWAAIDGERVAVAENREAIV